MKNTFLLLVLALYAVISQCSNKVNPVEEISDPKQFKQLLRTRTNVMVLFVKSRKAANPIHQAYKEAASEVRGIGTMIIIDCSGQGQKLCRQLKAVPEPYVLHHYKDGKFHKVYDRQETTKSLVRFMNDPTGDVPWEEEPAGRSVVHLDSPKSLSKLLKKHKRALVMFYAPWCVYCKQMKPEYAAAAAKVRSEGLGVLAAMDVVRPENAGMRVKYNITGFPTVHFFKDGEILATYEGENKQDKIVEFVKDPLAVAPKPKEIPWSEEESEVRHLTSENFDQFIENNPSILVMFYAPWCGHCKRLKPQWTKAALIAQNSKLDGILAAVDATQERQLAERFKVKGFPTIKYFKDGEFAFDTPNLRDAAKIIEFLEDPKEPPPAPPPEPAWADVPSEVVHLNEENFKNQLRSKRHALVMFYAPWCGHCKSTKPEFEAAAERLKEASRIVLAAVDCTENSALCKLYNVKGYPTFKYFKYQKDVVDYDGGRKAADFISYLTKLEPDAPVLSDPVEANTPAETLPEITDPAEKAALNKLLKARNEPPDYPGWDKLLHLTDENYKDLIKAHQHLLIMFHARWCNNCREVKPIFAKMAKDYDSSLGTLAACDTDKAPNLVDDYLISSLPLFKYVRNGKSVMDYTGERTAAGLTEFFKNMKTIKKDEL